MATRGSVGVINPDGTVTVRYVHYDATLDCLPADIAAIWSSTFGCDTTKTVAALLEHDWERLDSTVTAGTTTLIGDVHPVPGIGMAFICPLTQQPVTATPTQAAPEGLLFLLNPTRPTVLVITAAMSDDLTGDLAFDLATGDLFHLQHW